VFTLGIKGAWIPHAANTSALFIGEAATLVRAICGDAGSDNLSERSDDLHGFLSLACSDG
jgi:hypothetical protein